MAANRVAADNPLHDQTAAPADGGLFPRITHPYPCGGCAAFHDDESGFCAQCSRRRLVPPHAIATLARAQRKVYLGLLTLVMSVFETSDKLVIGVFALSTTLVVLFWFLTKAVATGDPAWVAALVVVAVAAICCGPVMSRMIRAIEAVGKGEDHALPMANGSAAGVTGPAAVDAIGAAGEDWRDVYERADAERRSACSWA